MKSNGGKKKDGKVADKVRCFRFRAVDSSYVECSGK